MKIILFVIFFLTGLLKVSTTQHNVWSSGCYCCSYCRLVCSGPDMVTVFILIFDNDYWLTYHQRTTNISLQVFLNKFRWPATAKGNLANKLPSAAHEFSVAAEYFDLKVWKTLRPGAVAFVYDGKRLIQIISSTITSVNIPTDFTQCLLSLLNIMVGDVDHQVHNAIVLRGTSHLTQSNLPEAAWVT